MNKIKWLHYFAGFQPEEAIQFVAENPGWEIPEHPRSLRMNLVTGVTLLPSRNVDIIVDGIGSGDLIEIEPTPFPGTRAYRTHLSDTASVIRINGRWYIISIEQVSISVPAEVIAEAAERA